MEAFDQSKADSLAALVEGERIRDIQDAYRVQNYREGQREIFYMRVRHMPFSLKRVAQFKRMYSQK